MGAKDQRGVPNFDPRSMVDRFYVGDHYKLLLRNIWPMGLMVSEYFFKDFPIISLCLYGNSWTPGLVQFGPKGIDWQDLCKEPLDIAKYYI